MNVVLFGATGMVGSGVLIECLQDPAVESILSVGRRPCGVANPKLRELILADLGALDEAKDDLSGYDACFFCTGVSAAGMSEADYRHVTAHLTLAAARVLAEVSPGVIFCYVSGQGTDGSGTSRFMWARVKGETENELLRMPLDAYMFRPGLIRPLKGVRSRTRAYQAAYVLMGPLFPLLERGFPRHVTTTVKVGRAMIRTAQGQASKRVLETADINALAGAG